MANIAAFFDIDGTISRSGFIAQMFKKMIKFELIDEQNWHANVKPLFDKWSRRMGSYDDYLMQMVTIYNESIRDVSPLQIDHIARRVIQQQGEYVYVFTRERIRMHKERGHKVIAISGSASELVSQMAARYNMDDYKGTIFTVGEDGRYTGELIPMWDRVSKRRAIMEFVDKYDIDLSKSYAYGDTTGDTTMLSLVGKPYAINPTRELIQEIQANRELHDKVNVIVERKDMIYRINLADIHLEDKPEDF